MIEREGIQKYKTELREELKKILSFWMEHTIDRENGGFYGRLDNNNRVYPEAPKGSVLNSRILWCFSSAYNLTNNKQYLNVAKRAFNYIADHFFDKQYGGIYWTVDYRGCPSDTKKQVYALSFAIYGLAEYYTGSKNDKAKELAIELYEAIIEHSHDEIHGGYVEAFTRDWEDISDLRLSAKDANEKKSMNTHLHVLEAFTNLYRIWPDKNLKKRIRDLVAIFLRHIIDPGTSHLLLFFDDGWKSKANTRSYGHDIEAAWLIQEAAGIIHDKALIKKVNKLSVKLAEAASEGLDSDGGLWYEFEVDANRLVKEKHSWPQAEAMIGFFNCWQITGDRDYLQKSLNSWAFVKNYILNKEKGEWYWGVTDTCSPMAGQDKVGLWKCPYHNSRACMEIISRINKLAPADEKSKMVIK